MMIIETIIIKKSLIVLSIIGFIYGFYDGYKQDGIAVGLLTSILGMFFLPLVGFCILCLFAGIKFLFS